MTKKYYLYETPSSGRPYMSTTLLGGLNPYGHVYSNSPGNRPSRKLVSEAMLESESLYFFDDTTNKVGEEQTPPLTPNSLGNQLNTTVSYSGDCFTYNLSGTPFIFNLAYAGSPFPYTSKQAVAVEFDLTYTGSDPSFSVDVTVLDSIGSRTEQVELTPGVTKTMSFVLREPIIDSVFAIELSGSGGNEYEQLSMCNVVSLEPGTGGDEPVGPPQ